MSPTAPAPPPAAPTGQPARRRTEALAIALLAGLTAAAVAVSVGWLAPRPAAGPFEEFLAADGATTPVVAANGSGDTAVLTQTRPTNWYELGNTLAPALLDGLSAPDRGDRLLVARFTAPGADGPTELGFSFGEEVRLLYLSAPVGRVAYAPSVPLFTAATRRGETVTARTELRTELEPAAADLRVRNEPAPGRPGCTSAVLTPEGGDDQRYTFCPRDSPGGAGLVGIEYGGADEVTGWVAAAGPRPAVSIGGRDAAALPDWAPAAGTGSAAEVVWYRAAAEFGQIVPDVRRPLAPVGNRWLLVGPRELIVADPMPAAATRATDGDRLVTDFVTPGGWVTAAARTAGLVVTATDRGELSARTLAGEPVWSRRTDSPISELQPSGDALLATGARGGVELIDAATGATRWRTATGRLDAAPVVDDTRIAVLDNGTLVLLSAADGEQLWTVRDRTIIGAALLPGGVTVAAAGDGTVLGLGADRSLLWSQSLPEPPQTVAGGGDLAVLGGPDATVALRGDGSTAWQQPGVLGIAAGPGWTALATDGRVLVLDDAGAPVRDLALPNDTTPSQAMTFGSGPDGLLVTGSTREDDTRELWWIR